jgi:hypothetical protein
MRRENVEIVATAANALTTAHGMGCREKFQVTGSESEVADGANRNHAKSRSNNEGAMKLNSTQLKQTLAQFEAQPIPDDHPLVPKLNELFGDHTFLLDVHGLNVVEPVEDAADGAQAGTVVNVANWSDSHLSSLAPHDPKPTEVVVILETKQ